MEAELPEKEAHKTKVVFELFAKVPGKPERISQAEGQISDGKAVAKIPVYIPQYKDDEGGSLAKVEYYFTAKHSASDLLEDDSVVKVVDEMAERLIESHILPSVSFQTDKSFLSPGNAPVLKSMIARIKAWKETHPDGKLAIFGHADAVGREEYNKKLSERRAEAVYAFLVNDVAVWKALYEQEKWGLVSTQALLKHLGHDPGPIDGLNGNRTTEAVKAFQTEAALPVTGDADTATREALYRAFMEDCNPESLSAKDFDSIDGKPFTGCGESNLAEATQGACDANRRVAVFLLKSNKNFPIQYPCKQGTIAPCGRQKDRKGSRRTPGFGCFFYDQLVVEQAVTSDEGIYYETPDYTDLPESWLPLRFGSRVTARQAGDLLESAERAQGDSHPIVATTSAPQEIRYWHHTGGAAWTMEQAVDEAEDLDDGAQDPDEDEEAEDE